MVLMIRSLAGATAAADRPVLRRPMWEEDPNYERLLVSACPLLCIQVPSLHLFCSDKVS